jgi:two-component system OmpR family sensor kinase
MTITNRLTLFFQLALGLVLIGFSVVMYSLTSWHLHAQADRHLQSAMDLLVAAIEVHPGDVEWEPLERRVTLGDSNDPTSVRWTLRDEAGNLIDRSENIADGSWPDDLGRWRLLVSQLNAGDFEAKLLGTTLIEPATSQQPPLPNDRSAKRSSFVLTVGLSNGPINAELLTLALALTGVSLATCAIAVVWGRRLCRRALLPVRQMADTARVLQQTPESSLLLAVPDSNDELADMGEAFNGLLQTLRESIERQTRFAGDASHQLRTPLTATQTAVDVALRRERTPAEYQRVLSIVQRRSRELTRIVETLLSLARHSGQSDAAREIIDLNQCCRERIDAWKNADRANDLVLQDSPRPVQVQSDSVLVAQIIDNLLDNACKYSEPGSTIKIQVYFEGLGPAISISDKGAGIPSQELSQVFEPFFRSSQARWNGHKGAGLGLAIACRFARYAGGRLEVSSVEGQGSEFRLLFSDAAN